MQSNTFTGRMSVKTEIAELKATARSLAYAITLKPLISRRISPRTLYRVLPIGIAGASVGILLGGRPSVVWRNFLLYSIGSLASLVRLSDIVKLANLFPWEGLPAAINTGFFGTAVGFNEDGERSILVYANRAGSHYLKKNTLPELSKIEKFPISIVEIDSIQFLRTPCSGGVSISPQQAGGTGTLGAWLQRNPAGVVGISNNHVIANFNSISQNSFIIQPGWDEGGSFHDVLGKIEGVVPLKQYDQSSRSINYVDVAWFHPLDPNVVKHDIGNTGISPMGEEDLIQRIDEGETVPVWYYGSSSKIVHGEAVANSATIFFRGFMFEDQIQLSLDKLDHGDSGSLILTSGDNKIGGLLFAGYKKPGLKKIGFANPWQYVKRETRLQFSY